MRAKQEETNSAVDSDKMVADCDQYNIHFLPRPMKRGWDDSDGYSSKRPCLAQADQQYAFAQPTKRPLETLESAHVFKRARAQDSQHAGQQDAMLVLPELQPQQHQYSYSPSDMQLMAYVEQPSRPKSEEEQRQEQQQQQYPSVHQLLNGDITECRVLPPLHEFPADQGSSAVPIPPPTTGYELVLYVPPPSIQEIAEKAQQYQQQQGEDDSSSGMMLD